MDIGITAIINTKLDEAGLRQETQKFEEAVNEDTEIQPDIETGVLEQKLVDWARDFQLPIGGTVGDLQDFGAFAGAASGNLTEGTLEEQGKQGGIQGALAGKAGEVIADRAGGTGSGALEGALAAGGGGRLAGLLSKIVTPAGLAIVGGGALFIGMAAGIAKLAHDASPALQKVTEMFGTAMKLFFRPLGTWAATKLMPLTQQLLMFAADWNQWAAEGGLAHAFGQVIGMFFNDIIGDITALATGNGDEQDGGAGIGTFLGAGIGFALGGPLGMAIGGIVGNLAGQLVGILLEKIRAMDWAAISDELKTEATDIWIGTKELITKGIKNMWPFIPASHLLKMVGIDSFSEAIDAVSNSIDSFDSLLAGLEGPVIGLKDTILSVIKKLNKIPGVNVETGSGDSSDSGDNGRDSTPNYTDGNAGGNTGGSGEDTEQPRERGKDGYHVGAPDTKREQPRKRGRGGFHVGPDYEMFAEGGFVTKPTNAVIGEAGAEAVVPLDRFEDIVRSSVSIQVPETGGNDTRSDDEMKDSLTNMERLLAEVVTLLEEGGDISLEVDGETLARTNENASDRFLSRRTVDR